MNLMIFNSLSGKKEEFVPIQKNTVNLYVCGITIYDYCHIGHARTLIIFDMITRYLRYKNYSVNYVRNITDIDDKIIKRSVELGITVSELTERFILAKNQDEFALGIIPPTIEPRATDYIEEIISLIEKMLSNKTAYQAANGDIYFSVRNYPKYGELSHRKIEELISGTRIQQNKSKIDSLDFVLWKMSKPNEPKWQSPWGEGRPGWHIECSAMSTKCLGQPFDIHGGGLDLKFPHHENECAQSTAANDKPYVNWWMHAGLLEIDNIKMSKSLGNFITIRDFLKQRNPEVIRHFMLSGHYRSPLKYSESNMEKSRASMDTLYTALRGLPEAIDSNYEGYIDLFSQAMNDDFNTPEAITILFSMAHEINRYRDQGLLEKAANLANGCKKLGNILGLLTQDPEFYFQGSANKQNTDEISSLLASRDQARLNKNWKLADTIRNKLYDMGVIINDNTTDSKWRFK